MDRIKCYVTLRIAILKQLLLHTCIFFLCNFKGHFRLYLKLPICTKNVCNPKANRFRLSHKAQHKSVLIKETSLFFLEYDCTRIAFFKDSKSQTEVLLLSSRIRVEIRYNFSSMSLHRRNLYTYCRKK